MNDSDIIEVLDIDLKRRILYLARHSNINSIRDEVTTRDLKLANEYASMNLRVLAETNTSMLELIVMNTYDSRIQDMHIVELYNKVIGSKKAGIKEELAEKLRSIKER